MPELNQTGTGGGVCSMPMGMDATSALYSARRSILCRANTEGRIDGAG